MDLDRCRARVRYGPPTRSNSGPAGGAAIPERDRTALGGGTAIERESFGRADGLTINTSASSDHTVRSDLLLCPTRTRSFSHVQDSSIAERPRTVPSPRERVSKDLLWRLISMSQTRPRRSPGPF
jgi:hypothetical protein